MNGLTITLPFNRAQYQEKWRHYNRTWRHVDSQLYSVCEQFGNHGNVRHAIIKVNIIDGVYSAGLRRHAVLEKAALKLTENATVLRSCIESIDHGWQIMTPQNVMVILKSHNTVVQILREITDGHKVRSFVSKYLHFHRPVVPIYDQRAATNIGESVGGRVNRNNDLLPWGADYDADYWKFTTRLLYFKQHGSARPLRLTTRQLDWYFWSP